MNPPSLIIGYIISIFSSVAKPIGLGMPQVVAVLFETK